MEGQREIVPDPRNAELGRGFFEQWIGSGTIGTLQIRELDESDAGTRRRFQRGCVVKLGRMRHRAGLSSRSSIGRKENGGDDQIKNESVIVHGVPRQREEDQCSREGEVYIGARVLADRTVPQAKAGNDVVEFRLPNSFAFNVLNWYCTVSGRSFWGSFLFRVERTAEAVFSVNRLANCVVTTG